jgi:hypothetical protein
MKKISTLLSIIAITVFTACSGPEGVPGRDGYDGLNGLNGQKGNAGFTSDVMELANVNFTPNNKGVFRVYKTLNPKINDANVVLIYRLTGLLDSQTPIWQPIPRTIFLAGGKELDYDFDFTKEDITIYARGNYDLTTTPDYLNGQTLRIVILPGSFSKLVNKNSYKDVIQALKIKDDQIQKISF